MWLATPKAMTHPSRGRRDPGFVAILSALAATSPRNLLASPDQGGSAEFWLGVQIWCLHSGLPYFCLLAVPQDQQCRVFDTQLPPT